jgi:hypothetical protein
VLGITSTIVLAEVKTLAEIASPDTAFRNRELPFILTSYLFPLHGMALWPSSATFAVLPAFFIQARESVKFCLLHFNAWLNGHLDIETG